MTIFDNQFYILGATTRDNRREITSLADEKSLLLDGNIVAEACNTLTNSQKRLSAEIRWFPGLDKSDLQKVLLFLTELKNGQQTDAPNILCPGILPALNIQVAVLSLSAFENTGKLKNTILEIGRLFELTYTDTVKTIINRDREAAGFPLLTDDADIEEAIRVYHSEIRQILHDKITALPKDQYLGFITELALDYASNNKLYGGCSIIDDILSDYELRMKPEIQNLSGMIIKRSVYIKTNYPIRQPQDIFDALPKLIPDLNDIFNDLSDLLEKFYMIMHPLQLAAKKRGNTPVDSSLVISVVRGFMIDLSKTYLLIPNALELAKILKRYFGELPEFAEIIQEDIKKLDKILQEVKEATEDNKSDNDIEEAIRRNRMDLKYTVSVFTSKVTVPPFCTCCMKPTTETARVSVSAMQQSGYIKTTRTVSINLPLCTECRMHQEKAKKTKWRVILLSAAIAAISVPIFNSLIGSNREGFWVWPFIIAVAAYMILGIIFKLPELGKEHSTEQNSVWISDVQMQGSFMIFNFTNWWYAKLFAKTNLTSNQTENQETFTPTLEEVKYRNRVKDTRFIHAVDHPIGIGFLVLLVTAGFFLLFGNTLTSCSDARVSTVHKPAVSSYYRPSVSKAASSRPSSITYSFFDKLVSVPPITVTRVTVSVSTKSESTSSKSTSSAVYSSIFTRITKYQRLSSMTGNETPYSNYSVSINASTNSVMNAEERSKRLEEIYSTLLDLYFRIRSMETRLFNYQGELSNSWGTYLSTGKDSALSDYNSLYNQYDGYYDTYSSTVDRYNNLVEEYDLLLSQS